jgi:uncharacterized protein YjiS (DUF1127 family)
MTTLEHAALRMSTASRPGFVARVAQSVAGCARALKHRREIYRLGAMTDAELSDIGLTRTDLHVAFRSPLGVDPTACLGSIAASRAEEREQAARSIC